MAARYLTAYPVVFSVAIGAELLVSSLSGAQAVWKSVFVQSHSFVSRVLSRWIELEFPLVCSRFQVLEFRVAFGWLLLALGGFPHIGGYSRTGCIQRPELASLGILGLQPAVVFLFWLQILVYILLKKKTGNYICKD